MRVQLVLPLALLLSGVVAKTTADTASTAVSDASATGDKTTATAEVTNTGDESGTATGTADDSTNTDTVTGSKSTKTKSSKTTTTAKDTDTWVASVQATVAPDLNGGATSLKDPGFVVLGLAFGLMMAGTAFL
ncbi:hypothetical protein G7Z17_g5739 [Cylindrodendrum hubeiense]|uniref:Uncharacterized protein n=1 Tax=Cylindrodendrum hubeiense TaxID=595255 RepID=A0A9P5HCC8_9HYPO|nr:hypothetical protein G7Z17_g5739 [Cylindrodendrum hubeiense]